MHDYLCSVCIGLLYISMVISPGFWPRVGPGAVNKWANV